MRTPLAVLLVLALAMPLLAASAEGPALSESVRYAGGATVPVPASDLTVSRGHACFGTEVGDGMKYVGCAPVSLSSLPEGAYDLTLSLADDLDPLAGFDWQLWSPACADEPCPQTACGTPGEVQAASGSVTVRIQAPCSGVLVWPGNGATRGTITAVAVGVPAQG